MADPTRYYDLVLMVDPEAPEQSHSQVVDQVRKQISSGNGELKGEADWGRRRMAYEIDHRGEAHYHLFQFQAETDLLEQLDRGLSIDDAVLRHRIIRLPGPPPANTPTPAPQSSPSYSEREEATPAATQDSAEQPTEAAAEAEAAPPVDAAAQEAAPAVEAAPAEAPAETAPPETAPAETAPPADATE